jgi:hypothetical protein
MRSLADEITLCRELARRKEPARLIAEVPGVDERPSQQAPSLLMILSGDAAATRGEAS